MPDVAAAGKLRRVSQHALRVLALVLPLAGALLGACGPASADVRDAADRVFTLAEPGFRGALDELQVSAAGDGTAFVLDSPEAGTQRLWRIGPDATRPQRIAVGTGDAWVSAISATPAGGLLLLRPFLDRIDRRPTGPSSSCSVAGRRAASCGAARTAR